MSELEDPRFDDLALDGIVACLGDDAAALREDDDEDERAKNMDDAAEAITLLRKQRADLRARLEQAEARCRELEDALRLVLPMAKGYAAVNRVVSNNEYVARAQRALSPTVENGEKT